MSYTLRNEHELRLISDFQPNTQKWILSHVLVDDACWAREGVTDPPKYFHATEPNPKKE
jgi:hypothetical protein